MAGVADADSVGIGVADRDPDALETELRDCEVHMQTLLLSLLGSRMGMAYGA